MKHRFETQKQDPDRKNLMASAAFFCAVIILFLFAASLVSKRTNVQELQTLEQAVSRGIVHCYSIEGFYPESLQYLKDHYGLYYDEERFFVDYQIQGSNIMPDVTIIDRRAGQ